MKKTQQAYEVNFDGIVGPTHNYAGLSHGNVASLANKASESNPLEAVCQGLDKMKMLADMGFKQAVLPPHERPNIPALKNIGFSGTDKQILTACAKKDPVLLSAISSASCMWTANAATVSPSGDTQDKKVHFTAANLVSKFHRSIEAQTTSLALKKIFKNPKHFVHHEPLPTTPTFGDEGAANHTRLCSDYASKGVEFFVYGKKALDSEFAGPRKFPARQALEASQAIARLHGLDEKACFFAQQAPDAIDAGVFHNDVAGVGNRNFYFYHQNGLIDHDKVMDQLKNTFASICQEDLVTLGVSQDEVSLTDAVKSYLFNSQLLCNPQNKNEMILVAPTECQETPSVRKYLENLEKNMSSPIKKIIFLNLRQSMRNGGGPACLRLRVALNEKELKATNKKVFMNEALYKTLTAWAKKHYRDRLHLNDLADPHLLKESRTALDQLTKILGLGSIYSFQK